MTYKRATKILVAFDHSPLSQVALRRGLEIAANLDNAELHIVSVIMLGDGTGAGIAGVPVHPTVSLESAQTALDKLIRRLAADWRLHTDETFTQITTHVRCEAPASEITDLAEEIGATLVVVGTHGRRGFQRVLLGSVAEAVVRQAPCEVLVVRQFDDLAEAEDRIPDSKQLQPPRWADIFNELNTSEERNPNHV